MKKTAGTIIGIFIYLFGWWLTGTEFPHERGAKMFGFVFEGIFFAALGNILTRIIYKD